MNTKLSDYNYTLPKELIAQSPITPRSESRLLIINQDKLEHKHFHNILDYLEPGDVLVLNDTRVIPAKLKGKKSTGAYAEIIIEHKENKLYQCRIKTKHPKKGTKILLKNNLIAEVIDEQNGKFFVKFNKTPDIEKYGEIPLPPYVKNKPDNYEVYQTVYSKNKGSIAAPTAGLHFTKELLKKIENKGVKIAKLTLHVNYGTFLPIRTENILAHKMEKEYYEINKETAEKINLAKRIIAVGTTSLRVLESASDSKGIIHPKKGWTQIYINPKTGIKSKTKLLITNFHLPKTSLLVLVSTFAGIDTIKKAYKEAIKNNYRFYSFGDATLLSRENIHPQ
ncbi:tRNA preQ1(34) S-adenosylmethionine ribosyltransferase-isomerase QueA [Candidatus Woesearchaeota archaeon]|nr:tRNA preQ1(34) S-adenosylmethionine ribosyltransferase-isomerase QueA [Candidatus Woesearchaeota archaeon]